MAIAQVNQQLSEYFELREFWKLDPAMYCRQRLGLNPTWQQSKILEAIAPKGSKVSVRSGHGIGKDGVAAGIIWWFIECHDYSRCACTAPSAHQLRDILWGELAKWKRRADALSRYRGDIPEIWLDNMFKLNQDTLHDVGAPLEWYAIARTARKENPEALQGLHASDMDIDGSGTRALSLSDASLLFVLDEACFDDKTEILTAHGWKFFKDLKGEDNVLTMNPDTGISEYKKPEKYYHYIHTGNMYSFDHRTISFNITPNHRLMYKYKKRGGYGWKIDEIQNIKSTSFGLPRYVTLKNKDELYFELPDVFSGRGHFYQSYSVDMDAWLEFLGWYFSEGHIAYKNGVPYVISISQKNEINRKSISETIKKIGFDGKEYKDSIRIHSWRLAKLLHSYGVGFNNKKIPRYIMSLSQRQIRLFLNSFLSGDGYERANGRKIYYTSSEGIANDLQELIILSGSYASIQKREMKGKRNWILNHWGTSSCDGFIVSEYSDATKSLAKIRRENIKIEHYDGPVYCVSVSPYHLIYVRRNGKCHWSGNSGIPDEIFEVAEGALSSPDSRVLMIGNPTRNIGRFAASHKAHRGEYKTFHFRSQDSPLCDPDYRPGLVRKFGEGSNVVRVRADGEFPSQDDDTLIALEDAEAALSREWDISGRQPTGLKRLGVDPARYGNDRTAFVCRHDFLVSFIAVRTKQDTMTTAGQAIAFAESLQVDDIAVDIIGLGSGVYDRVAEIMQERKVKREWYCTVTAVNVAQEAPPKGESDDAQAAKLRDYLWLEVRKWLKESMPCITARDRENASALVGELATPKFKLDSSGRVVVESKDDMKKRLNGSSPDLGDALGCTFSPPKKEIPLIAPFAPTQTSRWTF